VKENYVSYVLGQYIADGNFDAVFGDGWLDDEQLEALTSTVCDYAFAEYGIDAGGKYVDDVNRILKDMLASNVIVHQGDDYAGNWYKLRSDKKRDFASDRFPKNPVYNLVATLGEEALSRALIKISLEDNLRSMDEKWAEANKNLGVAEELSRDRAIAAGPNPDFFKSESGKQAFAIAVDKAAVEVEGSGLTNSEKAQAHGYLTAARALSDTPDPPVDLIWSILNRANYLAGIGSFFIALITLIAMVVS
jgi:hypothetical protein